MVSQQEHVVVVDAAEGDGYAAHSTEGGTMLLIDCVALLNAWQLNGSQPLEHGGAGGSFSGELQPVVSH